LYAQRDKLPGRDPRHGTGDPGYIGDLAVSASRVAVVGHVEGAGHTEIDVRVRIVAFGIVDVHTHYDPELCWPRTASPSPSMA
jgi:N-acyl-D-aspartate/D-glutamate deacylase